MTNLILFGLGAVSIALAILLYLSDRSFRRLAARVLQDPPAHQVSGDPAPRATRHMNVLSDAAHAAAKAHGVRQGDWVFLVEYDAAGNETTIRFTSSGPKDEMSALVRTPRNRLN